jgi:hypothetical protein
MKLWAAPTALAALAGCCVGAPEFREQLRIDPALAPAEASERVRELLDSPTLVVDFEPKLVGTTMEVYEFLLKELPFTAACVRALGRGDYVIESDAGEGPPGRVYRVDDRRGLKLQMRWLYRQDGRWVYLGPALYSGSSFGVVKGHTLTVLSAEPVEGGLLCEGRAYCRFESFFGILGKLAPGLFASAMRRKANLFIEAARIVSEESRRDPAGFCERMSRSPDVPPADLEKFRRVLIK